MSGVESWISSLATIGLLAITGCYAWQTRHLAIAARDSARAAQDSAESAREGVQTAADALAASVAGLDVRFSVKPHRVPGEFGRNVAVQVRCEGVPVWLRFAQIESIYQYDGPTPRGVKDYSIIGNNVWLWPVGSHALPTLMQPEVSVNLISRPEFALGPNQYVGNMTVRLVYSMSRDGQMFPYQATYHWEEEGLLHG